MGSLFTPASPGKWRQISALTFNSREDVHDLHRELAIVGASSGFIELPGAESIPGRNAFPPPS